MTMCWLISGVIDEYFAENTPPKKKLNQLLNTEIDKPPIKPVASNQQQDFVNLRNGTEYTLILQSEL